MVVGAVITGLIVYNTNARARAALLQRLDLEQGAVPGGGLLASGFIEAEEVELSSETGGRVVMLGFAEGDAVQPGDVVVQLDTSLLEAQRDGIQAQIDIAAEQRDLLAEGPRQEYIDQAKGFVALAQASLDAAKVAWGDALMLYANPQELELQLVEAETQFAIAQEQLEAARWQLIAAARAEEIYWDNVERFQENDWQVCIPHFGCKDVWLSYDAHQAPQRTKEAQTNFAAAQEALAGAEAILAILQGYASNPQGLLTQAVQAEGQFHAAEAALAKAEAELKNLEKGASKEDLAIADAQIAEAQAALDVLEAEIARRTVTSPIGGLILQQAIHEGELALPGAPLLTIADLETVELTVYLPTEQVGRVRLGQQVIVTVDSFPGHTFEGTVTYISDEHEYTPRNVQTQEERVNLVFAVRITLVNDDPDYQLKPGMPADALFED
jgi:multidrug resistance efflux pump